MIDDLVAFINARLDEDEAAAKEAWGIEWSWRDLARPFLERSSIAHTVHIARHDPARVLREVEAARADIALYLELAAEYDRTRHGADMMRRDALRTVLQHRAAVWGDHADYDQAWSPIA